MIKKREHREGKEQNHPYESNQSKKYYKGKNLKKK